MATNQVLSVDNVAGFLFSNASEYAAVDLGDLENTDTAPTAVQLDLGDSISTGVVRASTKCTFPAARAPAYLVTVSIEFATAPGTGETVDFYWGTSHSGTAGKGNMAQLSGTDVTYTAGAAEVSEGLKQMTFLGSLVCTADATTFIQTAQIAVFSPPDRYGILVVHNNTAVSFHTDAVEMAVAFDPIIPDIQAAA